MELQIHNKILLMFPKNGQPKPIIKISIYTSSAQDKLNKADIRQISRDTYLPETLTHLWG